VSKGGGQCQKGGGKPPAQIKPTGLRRIKPTAGIESRKGESQMNEPVTMPTGADVVKQLESEGIKPNPGTGPDPAAPAAPGPDAAKPVTPVDPKQGDKRTEAGKELVYDGKVWAEVPPTKPGETRQTADGKYEAFDGKDWKPTAAPVTPWKDGKKEYTPDQLRKALKDSTDLHAALSSVKKKQGEFAKVEAALTPIFELAKLIATDSLDEKGNYKPGSNGEQLRNQIAALYGDEAATKLDALAKMQKFGIEDPREQEFADRDAALNAREAELHYDDVMKKLIGENSFTADEGKEFDEFCRDYYTKMETDDTLPFREPEELYLLSPLYKKKIEAAATAKAEKEAADKQKLADEAARLKNNQPPTQQVGSGQQQEELTYEQLKNNILATVPSS
jgi:hypothetical protein